MEPDVLVVDYSLLRAFIKCERLALVEGWHARRRAAESRYLRAGSAVHAALEVWLHGEHAGNPEAAMAALGAYDDGGRMPGGYAAWAGDPANVPDDDRLAWHNVARLFASWLEDHPLQALPWVTEAVERPFAVRLGPRLVLVGKVDAYGHDRQLGQPYLVEHKTTGRVTSDYMAQFFVSTQQSLYMAAGAALGWPSQGVFVNVVELPKLPSDPRRICRSWGNGGHGVSFAECGHLHHSSRIIQVGRGPEEIATAVRMAKRTARRYSEAVTERPDLAELALTHAGGMFTGECSWCSLAEFCKYGAGALEAEGLHENAWQPVKGLHPGMYYTWKQVEEAAGGQVPTVAGCE